MSTTPRNRRGGVLHAAQGGGLDWTKQEAFQAAQTRAQSEGLAQYTRQLAILAWEQGQLYSDETLVLDRAVQLLRGRIEQERQRRQRRQNFAAATTRERLNRRLRGVLGQYIPEPDELLPDDRDNLVQALRTVLDIAEQYSLEDGG